MNKFWWAIEALCGWLLIEIFGSDVSMISLTNCVINDVNNDCRWLTLFLDNNDEFLMTWDLIQLEKIVGWKIRFDCIMCIPSLYEDVFRN